MKLFAAIIGIIWATSLFGVIIFFLWHWITGKPIAEDYEGDDF